MSPTRDDTQLNVFRDFRPKLSAESKKSPLFLATSSPSSSSRCAGNSTAQARQARLDELLDREGARLALVTIGDVDMVL